MDICVSNYFKFKTDHENRYSNPRLMKHGLLRRYIMRWWNVRQYKNIIGKDETFEQFFSPGLLCAYASWSILDHDKFDAIIRFENLQGDFDAALSKLGMEKVRDIPVANKTAEKQSPSGNITRPIRQKTGQIHLRTLSEKMGL